MYDSFSFLKINSFSKNRVIGGILLFLALNFIYELSPIHSFNDSKYTLLVSEHLFKKGNLAVDEHFHPYVDSSHYPKVRKGETLPRHIRSYLGHLYYYYPAGTPILTVPFVAIINLFTDSAVIAPDGRYRPSVDRFWQKKIASMLVSVACLFLYSAAIQMLGLKTSWLIAFSAGLSTQFWSTASRGLQAHTWIVVLLSVTLFLIVRAELPGKSLNPFAFGSVLAFSFWVRPTSMFFIFPLSLYVFFRHRKSFIWVFMVELGWFFLMISLSMSLYGKLLPPYYFKAKGLSILNLPVGLAGQLISPSRGLFIFVPLTLFTIFLVWHYRGYLQYRGLTLTCIAAILMHTLSMSMFRNWWGGYSYGPRFYTDVIPLFVVLAILSLDGAIRSNRILRFSDFGVAKTFFFLLSFSFGALLNGAGAISEGGAKWNSSPESLAKNQMRAFDLKRSQFMCALFPSLLADKSPKSLPEE